MNREKKWTKRGGQAGVQLGQGRNMCSGQVRQVGGASLSRGRWLVRLCRDGGHSDELVRTNNKSGNGNEPGNGESDLISKAGRADVRWQAGPGTKQITAARRAEGSGAGCRGGLLGFCRLPV